MKIDTRDFRIGEGEKVDLHKRPTRVRPLCKSEAEYEAVLSGHVRELSVLQELLYATHGYSLLLIFQAMDAAGKDSAIKHVMSGVNPQGCQVFSFKHPSAEDLEHDFLWRSARCLPEKGKIGIFNRSYYEEVLIVRVHPEILKAENIPNGLVHKKNVWEDRYRSILNLERHLHHGGTRIVKFFLHLSKEEQRKRFVKRLDTPEKRWKISLADLEKRKYWKDYQKAYEACLEATSTKHAPWYAIPADDKDDARVLISQVLVNTLKDLKLEFPQSDAARKRELEKIRGMLKG